MKRIGRVLYRAFIKRGSSTYNRMIYTDVCIHMASTPAVLVPSLFSDEAGDVKITVH